MRLKKGILDLGSEEFAVPEILKVKKLEPRLHFTLVCGAISCPKLRNFLYRAADIERLLTENEHLVNNSEKFFFTEDDEFLIYTGLFDFYPKDGELLYGKDFSNLPKKMLSTCRSDIGLIENILAVPDSVFPDFYDWNVNKQ